MRAKYLDVHVFFGLLIFISACAAAFTGFTEKTIFGLSAGNYLHYDPEFLIANCTGYTIIIFATFVIYLATSPKFKRLNIPLDEITDGNSWKEEEAKMSIPNKVSLYILKS